MVSKAVPTKPLLLMLYGFPGSGKTYFARQLCDYMQAAHLQADRLRHELFEQPRYDKQEDGIITQLMQYMTGEFLSAGLSVVYDVNAIRASQRLELRELARRSHAQPLLVWFQIDIESAFTRNIKRDRRRADDKYSQAMDRTTFETVVGQMQNPGPAEDYVVTSGKHVFSTQFSAVSKKLRDLGLLLPSDSAARLAKPGLVNLVPNPQVQAGRVDMSRRNIMIR